MLGDLDRVTNRRIMMDIYSAACARLERELRETKEKLRKAVEFIRKVRELSEEIDELAWNSSANFYDYKFLRGDDIDQLLRDIDGMP